jgi:hypothetical protein
MCAPFGLDSPLIFQEIFSGTLWNFAATPLSAAWQETTAQTKVHALDAIYFHCSANVAELFQNQRYTGIFGNDQRALSPGQL